MRGFEAADCDGSVMSGVEGVRGDITGVVRWVSCSWTSVLSFFELNDGLLTSSSKRRLRRTCDVVGGGWT